jgi:CD2 antigen cytoplasmic tail-binding protein 2
MEQTRKVVEELTELADALLFGGEADSYELTKADWVHRFKLLGATTDSDLMRKRPVDDDNITADAKPEAKKQRRGYFDITTTNDDDANGGSSKMSQQHEDQVMWEYKGNEDGSIHGPYTSRQMLEWTSCGYFVGESAVDIRRVGSLSSNVASSKKKVDETTTPPPKTDVDDLMADLESDEEDNNDDDGGGGGSENATRVNAESSWMRSDRVDFSLYL